MGARALRRAIASAGACALVLAPAAPAQTNAEQRAAIEVFQDYAPDGRIDPCKHTADELRKAAKTIPPDIEQYAADYPAAIAAAIEARARGECDETARSTPTPQPAATQPPAVTPGAAAAPAAPGDGAETVVPEPPAPETAPVAVTTGATAAGIDEVAAASTSTGAPLPVVLLGVLAGLLALLALIAFLLRRAGVGEDRWAGAAHAIREARWRASGTWEDFQDWVRLGR